MCTRIDEALSKDEDEPPTEFASNQLPECSDDGDSDQDVEQGSDGHEDNDHYITDSDRDKCGFPQYSTKIHERVFDSLVTEGWLTCEQGVPLSYDQCPLFHAVSAHSAKQLTESEGENPFVRDFLRFERCLAEVIVENLNVHVKDALNELISKQKLLIETMFHFKFIQARKAISAQHRLRFIIEIEERVYQEMKTMTAGSHFSQLRGMIKEVRNVCLQELPQKAGTEDFIVNEEIPKARDKQVANEVREFVRDEFNKMFCERARHQMKVLNVADTVERCVKSMQDQVKHDLQAVRIVKTVIQAGYQLVSKEANVNKGLPFMLILKDIFSRARGDDLNAKYTKQWKETVARDFLKSLKSKELATEYCKDIEDTLEKAHKDFRSSIAELEAATQEIVDKARRNQHQIRISDGYDLAAVYLKSKSILDTLQYGVPEKAKVIGKGPTSTVYRCKGGSWGTAIDVVIKAREPWPPESTQIWPASLYFAK